MITYVCLAVLLLFVAVRSILFWRRNKDLVPSQELDRTLIYQINRESDQYEQ
ncbi:hypothetical protein J41TS12_30900 [Paenibacillus antibioticophila]|uniref:Uncharacterized protein n=1 Tax=Paenibacillus antibioticophila TaxID=1274374 RepID=A0A920CIE6_9BACL|nr:hypothetical protein J41TS12_30900 [Paenibacillus antibioticophila]